MPRPRARGLMVLLTLAAGLVLAAAPAGAAVSHPADGASHRSQAATLSAVSCTSIRHCLAVGHTGSHLPAPALAELFNGARWRLTPRLGIRAPINVDCSSASFCMAVGQIGASNAMAIWDGRSWKIRPSRHVFGALSCVTRTFCMDAGFGGNALTWNGKAWRELPTPRPAGSTDFDLSGVSCTSASFCMAVGWNAEDPDGIIHQTVAETWNGSAWKIIPSPAHKQETTFNDVSCTTAQHCMAIGSFFIHRRPTFTAFNVAGLWTGAGWTVMHLPGAVGDPFGFDLGNQGLASISCATSSSCMAAGSFLKFGTRQPGSLAIAWNGTRWRLTTPRGPKGGIADVSCAAANRCIAVGHAGTRTMAQRWNGTSWTLMKTPAS